MTTQDIVDAIEARFGQMTDAERLEITTEALKRAVSTATQAQATAKEAQARAGELVEKAKNLADFLHGSVAAIFDDEEVLHFKRDTDPHRLMVLLLRAVEECRSMILAESAASRTVQ